jgi:hypothetical protein
LSGSAISAFIRLRTWISGDKVGTNFAPLNSKNLCERKFLCFYFYDQGGRMMSELKPLTSTSQAARRVVASFKSYEEAQRAVDFLSDENFPVKRVAIVGEGLRLVEQVTGRLTWWKATVKGLLNGAVAGFILGWLIGLFNVADPLVSSIGLAIWGLCFGAFIGAITGALAYASTGGRRDFTSVGNMQAEQYNILVDIEVADQAERLLSQKSLL